MADQQQKTTYTAAEVAVLEETIRKQKTEITELKRKLEHMNEVFANAQRARFGQSSEKNTYVLQEQLGLFNEADATQNHKAAEPTEETFTVNAHPRSKKRSLGELPRALPVKEVLLELEESQLVCDKCGGKMKPIGKKFVRHELEIIPKQVILKAIYAVTYACDKCEKGTGFAHVVSVKPPVPLMKHSLAAASTVADVMANNHVTVNILQKYSMVIQNYHNGERVNATCADASF